MESLSNLVESAYMPLVMVCGLPGVGKTIHSLELADFLSRMVDGNNRGMYAQYTVLSLDDCKDLAAKERRTNYRAEFRSLAEALFYSSIAKEHTLGRGIVAETTFKLRIQRQAVYWFANDHDLEVLLLEMFCDDEIARQRIRNDVTRQRMRVENGFVPTARPYARSEARKTWQPINNDDYRDRGRKRFDYTKTVRHVRYDSGENKFFYNFNKRKAGERFCKFVDDVKICLDKKHAQLSSTGGAEEV